MARGGRNALQEEQKIVRQRKKVRKQDRDPTAETGMQGRDLANWKKEQTRKQNRVQLLDLGLVTRLS